MFWREYYWGSGHKPTTCSWAQGWAVRPQGTSKISKHTLRSYYQHNLLISGHPAPAGFFSLAANRDWKDYSTGSQRLFLTILTCIARRTSWNKPDSWDDSTRLPSKGLLQPLRFRLTGRKIDLGCSRARNYYYPSLCIELSDPALFRNSCLRILLTP